MKPYLFSMALILGLSINAIAQNVGIGTNNPQTKLQVVGAISSVPGSATPAGGAVNIPGNVSVFYIMNDGNNTPISVTISAGFEGQYLTVYNSDANNDATFGTQVIAAANGVASFNYINGAWRTVSNTKAGGDLSGTYPNPVVSKIQGKQVSTTAPANGDVLKYNGVTGQYEPAPDQNSGGTVGSVTASSPLSSTGGSSPNISLTGVVPVANGGTGVSVTPSNGQILIGNGTGYGINTLSPVNNQTTVTNSPGSIQIGTVQDINTTSSPSFNKVIVTGSNQNDIVSSSSIQIGNNTNTGVAAGSIRYNGSSVQYSDGTTWKDISSGGTVTGISTNNGITGGTITTSGTIGLTGNALAVHNLSPGMVAITGSGTAANRSVTGTAGRVIVTNGDGVAGNPTVDLAITVTAGTGTKVTYDAYGRITGSTSLTATDVPAGSDNYIQNQNSAVQTAPSRFWISGDGRSNTSFTTPLVQSPAASNLDVTAATDVVLNTNSTERMRVFSTGGARISNVPSGDDALKIDMANGATTNSRGISISGFAANTNARTGVSINMANTSNSTALDISNIGSASMNGISINSTANGNGTGIRIGGTNTLGTGIIINGGTGINYNALNSGSGTGLTIGGTTRPNTGVIAEASGTDAIGGSFQASNYSTGTGLIGGVYSSGNTLTSPKITGVYGYASSNSTDGAEVQYGVYARSARGGNSATTYSYGLYTKADGTNATNNGLHVGIGSTASVVNAGTGGAIAGLFTAPANSGRHLALATTGGADVYLGSTDADRPTNFTGSVVSVGTGNTNTTYMYNARISGTTTMVGAGTGLVKATSGVLSVGTANSSDITDGAITSADIADGTIASVDIADGTITSADIADGTVTSTDIADGTVTSADILDGTIATADIGNAQVTDAKLSNTGVTASTYTSVTVNAQGRVTAGSNPTTLAGYGITDAIQNQNSAAQGANFWINGTGRANIIRSNSGSGGYADLQPGNGSQSGYMEVMNSGGTRMGYIGWDNANMNYQAENSAAHVFNGGTVVTNTDLQAREGLYTKKSYYYGTFGRHHNYVGGTGSNTYTLGTFDFCALAGHSELVDEDDGDQTHDMQCNIYTSSGSQPAWGDGNNNVYATMNYAYNSRPTWYMYVEVVGSKWWADITCNAICINFDY
jgi:hypothetical protein